MTFLESLCQKLSCLNFHNYCRDQHEVLTRAEWIPASTGDAGPAFNRHWVSVILYLPPAICTARHAAPVNMRR